MVAITVGIERIADQGDRQATAKFIERRERSGGIGLGHGKMRQCVVG